MFRPDKIWPLSTYIFPRFGILAKTAGRFSLSRKQFKWAPKDNLLNMPQDIRSHTLALHIRRRILVEPLHIRRRIRM